MVRCLAPADRVITRLRCSSILQGEVDTSQKVRRFSRGAFHYAVTRVTNVTIGQAVASGSATKYRSDDQENTLREMTPEETEVT